MPDATTGKSGMDRKEGVVCTGDMGLRKGRWICRAGGC